MGSTVVRKGTIEDVPQIVLMAQEFWGHTIYDEDFCPETVSQMCLACIDAGLMAVVEKEDLVGFACGLPGPLLGNKAVKCGLELAWWVQPEHRKCRTGIDLLVYLEDLAREAGIKYWNMVFMESSMPEAVEKIYQKLGYNRVEVTYSKVL